MNAGLAQAGVPGVVTGESSVLRYMVGGDFVPEARDYHARELRPEVLVRGGGGDAARLMQLALLNRGVFFFGNGANVSSVHSDEDVARTLEAWEGALEAVRAEGLVAAAR
jgi:hypothetical protein